jgi:FKBP-type peptidyl-prolyl cis-trans isomerase 2
MTEPIKKNDFITLEYTGKLVDGRVFDTTSKEIAESKHLHAKDKTFGPVTICVGENQVILGFDEKLIGKVIGKEYSITVPMQKGFGKKDVKKVQLVPLATFKEHKLNPHPGLQVDFDGKIGTVMRVSGGRVMVNFNHPLSGRDLMYDFIIKGKITDSKDKISSFIANILHMDKRFITVIENEKKVTIKIPFEMPAPLIEVITKKLTQILPEIKEMKFEATQAQTTEKKVN